jgi:hypothetical protein
LPNFFEKPIKRYIESIHPLLSSSYSGLADWRTNVRLEGRPEEFEWKKHRINIFRFITFFRKNVDLRACTLKYVSSSFFFHFCVRIAYIYRYRHGCRIFIGTTYQNGKNIPNDQ